MKGKFWRKVLAVATSVLMLSGGVPIQPLSQVFEDIAITASAEGTTVDLSTLADNYTAKDGDVLTGSTSGTVTIANNANIAINNATISGGIVCSGTAEITLVGTNSVTGAAQKAGIQIGGSGTTLTIKGNGSLTATGGEYGAGIGLGSAWGTDFTGGNIVIESGNITATGGIAGAGIGTGALQDHESEALSVSMGDIVVNGGTVTANGDSGAGIGAGYVYGFKASSLAIGKIVLNGGEIAASGRYGIGYATPFGMSGQSDATITIEGLYIDTGIELVDATSIRDFENIVYTNNENDVTANKTDYFTIVEDGDRRIIASKDDTDYAITIADGIENGTLTAAATAKYLETVTVTATPDFGYRLVCLVVKDAYDNDVALNDNTFLMPKGGVTVSAEFAQVYHGTTEFVLGYFAPDGYEKEATIYDGVTTVNLQSGISYSIGKDYYEFVHGEDHIGGTESSFLLDNNIDSVDIPYAGGTGEFVELLDTEFNLNSNSESGFYDITMTDAGNGKWSVSILKTVGVIDNIPDQTYTGSEITPEPLVMAGSLNLTKGTDYEYSYTNNTDAGTATVRATFKGNYASLGYVEKTFNIVYPDGIGAHLAGHSLSLTGNIGVNFYMELDDSVAANENAYMHFTLPNGKTQDVKIGQAEPKTISGKTYYVFQCNVAAKEMTDTIKAQMFSGGKSGQPYEYTVKEYADYLFANAYEDDGTTVKNQDYVDAIPLVKAMLNYGAYSQIYFGHHTEELANGGTDSTDIQNVDASTINKPYEPDYTYLGSTGDTTFEGATLSLRSETTLSLYFKSSRDLSFACYPYEVEKNTTAGGYQIARIRGIKAADLDETFGLVIDDAAETGTIRTFLGHVDYCPLTYCYNVLNGGSDDEDLQNVCKAMYLYWQAAKAYSE